MGKELGKALRHNVYIRVLSMRDNEFTEKDLVLIADAIDANESLVNVDL